MAEDDKEERWYFVKDVLSANSPSRRHGYDSDKELSCRQQAANLIQDMGQKLCVSQLCINTAIVYMHRFYVFHSLHAFPRNNIAAAALFLAAKVEEQPRKVEHVLKVAHLCLHRDNPSSLDVRSEAYQEQANELTLNESIILQTLGFEVAIDHPHTHVVRCCQLVKASKDLAQTSYFMASNSLHLTTMCLQYKPTVVACFCIHLACKWSNWEIPRSSEGKDWFWYVNQSVTLDLLEQMTSEFLIIFDKCSTKIKKKMMAMNQSNPVNFATPGNAPQENYHFDEPRKLIGAEANRPPEGFAQMQRAVAAERNEQIIMQQQQQQQIHQASVAAPGPTLAPPVQSHQHPARHMDYKEYKEKRDRAERERLHRENFQGQHQSTQGQHQSTQGQHQSTQGQHQSTHVPPQYSIMKPQEKSKIVVPQQQPQQQQQPPTQQSSHRVPPHKSYPQQQRGHPNLPIKEPIAHPSRQPGKEALKRKFEEAENSSNEYQDPNHAKNADYRHKLHYPAGSYPGQSQPPEMHPAKDVTNAGIRDIMAQSYGHRDKAPRLDDKMHPNYHYQRPASEKYGSSGRSIAHPSQPSQPPLQTHGSMHQKSHRDDTKKQLDDLPLLSGDQSNNDWHQKAGHQHAALSMERQDRSNILGKTSAPAQSQTINTRDPKPRDPKYKTHHSHSSSKESGQKTSSLSTSLHPSTAPPPHKKPHEKLHEKPVDKSRGKYQDQPERGLPSSMDKLLMSDDVRQKPVEMNKGYPGDIPKKEKTSAVSKIPHKPKPGTHSAHYKSQDVSGHVQPSLFDISDMDLPQLLEPLDRPAKLPRLEEKKKAEHGHGSDKQEDRKKSESIGHADRRDDRRKLEFFSVTEERKKNEYVEERKKSDVFGLGDLAKPAPTFVDQNKPKLFSIFSPENTDPPKNLILSVEKEHKMKSNGYISGYPKKMQPSLFSPPASVSHRSAGSSSSSSERDVVITPTPPPQPIPIITIPSTGSSKMPMNYITSNDRQEKEKRHEEPTFSIFDAVDQKSAKEKPPNAELSSIKVDYANDSIINYKSSQYAKELVPPVKNEPAVFNVKTEPLVGGVVQALSNPPQSIMPMASQVSQRPSVVSSLHSNLNEAGAIIFPPAAEKFPESHVPTLQPKSSPVSTVNLMNMVDMVDTRSNVTAVIKPIAQNRNEAPKPVKLSSSKEHEKPIDEKLRTEDSDHHKKSEKKKSKDKDRDRDGHRHKDKKKSDGKKEKKKHKDKDKERKKESHKDKDKDRESSRLKIPETPSLSESSLKITIPKDKISEVTGLKLKISKDKTKPVPVQITTSKSTAVPESGSLKITIKKDAIANYKDDRKSSKKKESSHSSHKSSKSSKPDSGSHKSSKSSSSSNNNNINNRVSSK